ncbi:DUF6457 domain-containing protein [Arthrobacter sp. MI7-26]|uniref:DUF6457 domain-containing protein n=1 Tax=Arthrobacter sp. MI7-26 TaxID=2993653 RepID=UPI00224880D0|nr:DUF6457 domain-containing protein [Arthrobacter sp. MI7-26]MCX2748974.1 DUF6457 domain-containing protein [Arthrobacter sp. MI7-26]
MTLSDDEAKILKKWSHRLAHALQILDLDLDEPLVLDLAEESSRAVSPSAGTISALMVGYAAGLAAGNGSAGSKAASDAAIRKAIDIASRLCEDAADSEESIKGWADSAQ